MIQRYYFVLLFTLFLVSCGGDEDSSSNSSLLDLDGKWVSNCYGDEDVSLDHTIDEFTFSGSTFETSYKTWSNSGCSGIPTYSGEASGTYTVGHSIITSSGLNAIEVDFQFELEGRELTVMEIIRLNGDEFNYGAFIDLETRPTELDFNIVLTRQ